MSKFSLCPRCEKKGRYMAAYDPNPDRGTLYLCRYCVYTERTGGYPFLHRKGSVYHLLSEDDATSKCGAVANGEEGYKIVERGSKPLRSMTCSHCLKGNVVRQR